MKRTIDPELKYCPQCGDEYRVEIDRCAVCAVTLLDGQSLLEQQRLAEAKKGSRRLPLSPNDELVSISKGAMVEMRHLQALLERQGIPSLVVNEEGSCRSSCCGGPSLTVQVRAADLEDVQAFMVQDHIRSTALHEHDLGGAGAVFDTAADTAVCPACGCTFPTSQNACPDCGLCFA
ncbi:DUF2007 domain-containing protein [Candidatus Electronema halotolerans]|jgi:hypothetical protein